MKNVCVALPGSLTQVVLWSSLVYGSQQQLTYDGRGRQLDRRLTFVVYHRHIGALANQQIYDLAAKHINIATDCHGVHLTQTDINSEWFKL